MRIRIFHHTPTSPLFSLTPSPSRWTPLPPNKLLFYFHVLLCACVCMCVLVGVACMSTAWGYLPEQGQQHHHREMRPSPQAGFLQRLLSPLWSAGWSRASDSAETWEAQVSVCLTPAIFIPTPAAVPCSAVTEQAAQGGSWNQLPSANSGSVGPCLPVLTPKMNIYVCHNEKRNNLYWQQKKKKSHIKA